MSLLRVLIADDDPELTDALTRRCRQLGLAVETATSSMEALRKLELRPPDVAILDVDMPEGNGLAVCEMIAHHKELKNLPVIMLTGKKDPNTVQRCHELRAYYVPKCADVWPRIGPLLEELLDLSVPRPAVVPLSAPPVVRGKAPASFGPPDLMDAVFAALASDDGYLESSVEAERVKPPARPWVLCIDDDAAFSLGLQMRLQEQGVEVLRAFAGREGYRCAFHSPAQAIILDYELPEGNGDYVLRRLKESPATKDIPVIVLTGLRDRHVERQMYNLGAASYMNKPYRWSELWEVLQRYLNLDGVLPLQTPHGSSPARNPLVGGEAADAPIELQPLYDFA